MMIGGGGGGGWRRGQVWRLIKVCLRKLKGKLRLLRGAAPLQGRSPRSHLRRLSTPRLLSFSCLLACMPFLLLFPSTRINIANADNLTASSPSYFDFNIQLESYYMYWADVVQSISEIRDVKSVDLVKNRPIKTWNWPRLPSNNSC